MTKETTRENVAETVRDIMKSHGGTERIDNAPEDLTKPHLVALPDGRKIADLTAHSVTAAELFKPLQRKGTAHLTKLDSLIDWANRNKGGSTVLFAASSPDAITAPPSLTCIADYHLPGEPAYREDATARHCKHRAVYAFPLSEEFKAWANVNGKALEKDKLGDFIEEQAATVLDPTPAILAGKISDKNADWENRMIETARKIEGRFGTLHELLALSKRFQVFESSNLSVTTNRDTGEAQIQFMNEHKAPDGGPLKIPNLFMIALPVFDGTAPYRMAVRFRYRKAGAGVTFTLTIYNLQKALDAAFDQAVETARAGTDLPVFYGTPEAT